MVSTVAHKDVAHLVEPEKVEAIDVLGPTIQFLTPPEKDDSSPCVMRGTIPPGVVIPLHSHPDPETFYLLSGAVEGLTQAGEEFEWVPIKPGAIFHVPGGAKHAWRNTAQAPAVMILISTSKIGRFFQELGTPMTPGAPSSWPPPSAAIRHFLETAARYGYWNATPEENARIGIALPAA